MKLKNILKIDQSRYETPNADYITLPSARTDIRDIFAVVKHSQVRAEQIEGRDWIIHPRALSFAHRISHMFHFSHPFIFTYFYNYVHQLIHGTLCTCDANSAWIFKCSNQILFRVSSPCRTNARWRYPHILSHRGFPCRLISERYFTTQSIRLIWQGLWDEGLLCASHSLLPIHEKKQFVSSRIVEVAAGPF